MPGDQLPIQKYSTYRWHSVSAHHTAQSHHANMRGSSPRVMSRSLPHLTLTTSTSSLSLTSPILQSSSSTHPSLLSHDPFLHCDDSRRSCGSSDLQSPTCSSVCVLLCVCVCFFVCVFLCVCVFCVCVCVFACCCVFLCAYVFVCAHVLVCVCVCVFLCVCVCVFVLCFVCCVLCCVGVWCGVWYGEYTSFPSRECFNLGLVASPLSSVSSMRS